MEMVYARTGSLCVAMRSQNRFRLEFNGTLYYMGTALYGAY